MEEEKIDPIVAGETNEEQNNTELTDQSPEKAETTLEEVIEDVRAELAKEVTQEADSKTETEASEAETKEPEKPKTTRKRIPKAEASHTKLEHVPDITFETIDASITDSDEEIAIEENFDHLSKLDIVDMLEAIVKEDDINLIKNKVAKLKVSFWKIHKEDQQKDFEKYLSEGGKKEDYKAPEDIIEERYNTAFTIYKEKRNKYLEEQEHEKQENLQKKLHLLEELKVLINSEETLKKTYDDFKLLQDKWTSIGQVPRTEVNNLWQTYHFLVDKFFDKVKINKELKDLDLKKNIERQLALCEKTEELLLEPSILKSFKQLQKYHDEWKEIGPVSSEKKEELWERFKSASDRINVRRREYYDLLHEEQEKNLIAKTALCEKAEQINAAAHNTANEWIESSDQMNELQKVWKTIGYTPKTDNNEIWDRFRNAVNNFHINKNEFFNKIREEQINNYNLKLNICAQAEALQNSQDWKKTTNEFINFQNEWKQIGSVPAKYSNKIWKRFRAACDIFFENKSKYFSNIGKNQDDNLQLKLELIKKVEEYQHVEDNTENLNNLKEFQKEWMNIGFVPNEQKDKIYNDFKAAINKQFEKLKASPSDKLDFKYKTKFDSVVNSPNAEWNITKESNLITTKMNYLKNDIKTWENNLGFLANSKNADILKEEFSKKINSAKEQLAAMQEKLNFLNNTKKTIKEKK